MLFSLRVTCSNNLILTAYKKRSACEHHCLFKMRILLRVTAHVASRAERFLKKERAKLCHITKCWLAPSVCIQGSGLKGGKFNLKCLFKCFVSFCFFGGLHKLRFKLQCANDTRDTILTSLDLRNYKLWQQASQLHKHPHNRFL